MWIGHHCAVDAAADMKRTEDKSMPATLLEKAATLDDVLHEVSRIKTMVSEAVDDSVRSALRAARQGRNAAEDAIDDARHAVKKNPLQAVGVVFVSGALVGALSVWLGMRCRS
jgi:ElaB/YqjD/DUF883 family membrane-anchored ribosome-binding protein